MTRILVTGGLGFIGAHLAERLLEDRDSHVTIVDDLSGAVLAPDELLVEIQGNRPGHLEAYLQPIESFRTSERFETIYHLASIVGPAAVLKRSGLITQAIVRSTYHVLELAMQSGARLVNVSTSETYGGGLNGYCREDTPRVIRGRATARQEYAAAKLAVEVSVENLSAFGELDAVTVRPFNVSGPRQSGRGGFVLPRFIGQAILGQPLTVFGDGNQVRAFTDARDVVTGLILCAECGRRGTAYNVGNPHNRVSIDQLADQILAVTGSLAGKEYVDPKTIYGAAYAEAADKYPDATRVMELGWNPAYRLVDTIRDTFQYMRRLPKHTLAEVAGVQSDRRLSSEAIAVA